MKKGIHPENYRMVAFKDMSNEDVFLTRSTVDTKETLEVDGVEYQYLIPKHLFENFLLYKSLQSALVHLKFALLNLQDFAFYLE